MERTLSSAEPELAGKSLVAQLDPDHSRDEPLEGGGTLNNLGKHEGLFFRNRWTG